MEIQYQLALSLLILFVCLHFRPYAWSSWVVVSHRNRSPTEGVSLPPPQDQDQPIGLLKRICGCCVLLIFPLLIFGIFAYGFPALLLRNRKYCPGDSTTDRKHCKEAADAGFVPMIFVYFPTALMWVFDTAGCSLMWSLHMALQQDELSSRNPSWSDVFARVMFPRFGLTMMYASLLFYTAVLQLKLEGDDTKSKLAYADRLEVNGWVSFSIAIAFWVCAAYLHARHRCLQSVNLESMSMRQEESPSKTEEEESKNDIEQLSAASQGTLDSSV